MLQKCTLWRVFSIFSQSPTKKFYIRQISRELKLAHTSIKLHIKTLLKEELIKRNDEGLYPTYQANRNENFFLYKKTYNLIRIKQSGLINYLEEQLTPDTIILFGSYDKGEDNEKSDIDIFIQGIDRKISVKKYETKLKRKIQLHIEHNTDDLPPELYHNIITGTVLSGFIRWSSRQRRTKKEHKA